MILVVGGIAVYGLYAYNQGAFGTPGTTTTTGTTTDTGVSTPDTTFPEDSAGNELSDVAIQCQNQGGRWQGTCCSCPNALCYNPCRGDQATNAETCSYEGGRWLPNEKKCYCPNLRCSNKFGGNENPSGGVRGNVSQFEKDSKLCQSEGGGWFGTKNCCSCPNHICKNKCPAPRAPVKLKQSISPKTPDAKTPADRGGSRESRGQTTGGGVGGPTKPNPKLGTKPATGFDKPDPKAGLCQSEGGKWTGKCCSCPNRFCKNKCVAAKYASAYLAGEPRSGTGR